MLHFFGADKEAVLNMTNFRHEDHRDNIQSFFGYEVSNDYPRFPYRQNQRVWYLDQLEEITFVRFVISCFSRTACSGF